MNLSPTLEAMIDQSVTKRVTEASEMVLEGMGRGAHAAVLRRHGFRKSKSESTASNAVYRRGPHKVSLGAGWIHTKRNSLQGHGTGSNSLHAHLKATAARR